MAVALANQGVDVIGVMRHPAGFLYSLQQAPQAIQNLPISPALKGTSEDLYLCSETVPFYHLKEARRLAMRIAWWQLAPFGLLGRTHYPQLGEYHLPFSSYSKPDAGQYYYYQPPLDQAWAAALKLPCKGRTSGPLRIALYPGKGRLRRLPDSLLALTRNSEVLLITRDQPQTREELFGLLSQCDGLISFDELSQLNLEAASLHIPVFLANRLFPDSALENFTIKRLRDWLTSNPQFFVEKIEARGKHTFNPWTAEDLMAANADTLTAFQNVFAGLELQALICRQPQINQLKNYSAKLPKSRAIAANLRIGTSGGALLALDDYLEYMNDEGSRSNRIFLKIRLLDALLRLFASLPFVNGIVLISAKRLYLRLSRLCNPSLRKRPRLPGNPSGP